MESLVIQSGSTPAPHSNETLSVSISTVAAIMYGSSFGLFFLLVFFLFLLRVAPNFRSITKTDQMAYRRSYNPLLGRVRRGPSTVTLTV